MARPTPLAATSTPKPTLPGVERVLREDDLGDVDRGGAESATFQTMSTVRSGVDVSTSLMPSATSRQCPRVSDSSERAVALGIRATSSADTQERRRVHEYGDDRAPRRRA